MPDAVYETVRQHSDENELVALTAAVVAINGWNRLAIAFRTVPGTFQLGKPAAIGTSIRWPQRTRRDGPMITVKRAYDPVSPGDGTRLLVERLWPRGVSKARLRIEAWLKEVAPSTALRRWFNHDPEKWDEFRTRYRRELDAHAETWRPIVSAARRGPVTLVYSAHDTAHNNAVALQEYLRAKMRRPAKAVAARRPRRSA